MNCYDSILERGTFGHDEIVAILNATKPEDITKIRQAAEAALLVHCGNTVYYRGLVEFSNVCRLDCLYCGIRKSNQDVERYTLGAEEIMDCARLSAQSGYGSIVLQSGERQNKAYLDMLVDVLPRIKAETQSETLPQGLGITLSIGEQSPDIYTRLFEAGAHRYLLRIETTRADLFARMHPPEQTLESRIACLRVLREIGYQVGTGVMIGLPDQTPDDLARDIAFFEAEDVDMIGMGPFIPNAQTPMADWPCPEVTERLRLSFLMIAATRLRLKDVNIAAATALQALDPFGREKGLRFGANVIMPQITPQDVRRNYQLYPGKPCLDENATECKSCLETRVVSAGRVIGYNQWGDSAHARRNHPQRSP